MQRQLIDIKESLNREEIINNGVFCGHEWGNNLFTEEMNAKAIELTQKFGEHIYDKYSYRGFFGLDLIIDEKNNCVYPIECNPRLTGVLPTLDLINDNNQIPTFIDLHMLEFISDKEEVTVNYKEIQQDLSRKIQGSHLHILSGEKPGSYSLNLESGVYRLEDSLVKIRPGYNFSHLKSDDEFLVVEGRTEIHPVAEKSRVCRIISRSPISRNDNQLNDFGRKIVVSTKDHIIYHEKV